MITVARPAYNALMDQVVLMDNGTHPMRIVGIGAYNDEDGTIYLHLSSLTQVNKGVRRDCPKQRCDFYEVSKLIFAK